MITCRVLPRARRVRDLRAERLRPATNVSVGRSARASRVDLRVAARWPARASAGAAVGRVDAGRRESDACASTAGARPRRGRWSTTRDDRARSETSTSAGRRRRATLPVRSRTVRGERSCPRGCARPRGRRSVDVDGRLAPRRRRAVNVDRSPWTTTGPAQRLRAARVELRARLRGGQPADVEPVDRDALADLVGAARVVGVDAAGGDEQDSRQAGATISVGRTGAHGRESDGNRSQNAAGGPAPRQRAPATAPCGPGSRTSCAPRRQRPSSVPPRVAPGAGRARARARLGLQRRNSSTSRS